MNVDPIRIFIVDDDRILSAVVRNEIRRLLGNRQTEITTFETGEFCSPFIYSRPDIAIVDYHLNSRHLPASNGIELIQQFKKESPETNVIFFTREDNIGLAVEAFEQGASDYVIKNEFMFWRLNMAVNQCLQHVDLTRQLEYKKKVMHYGAAIIALFLLAIAALEWYLLEAKWIYWS